MSINEGVKRMEAIVRGQEERLKKLQKNKKELEDKYISTKTSNLERERIQMRLTSLLHQISHLQKAIKSQISLASRVKENVGKLKTAKNRMNKLKAKEPNKKANATRSNRPATSFFSRLFAKKPAAAAAGNTTTTTNTATRKNHLSAKERKELQNFENELIREFGPITQANLNQAAREMEAENAMKEKLKLNVRKAKNEKQIKYYENMLSALNNHSGMRNLTNEEEKELNAYLAQLEGGSSGRRSTRRRR
jgi:hypothetical protein